jgi:transcriptional regulator with XRE-family HTH domain
MITMRNTAPSVRARQLGAELRRSRTTSGLAADQVAKRLGFSPSKVSRIEFGRRGAKVEDVAAMLALYGVTGKSRAELLELSQEAASGARGWWQRREMSANQRTLIELESTATRIVNFELSLIPGLLQTGEYTRTVLREVALVPPEEIENRMVTRLTRHRVLLKPDAPRFLAVIHERGLRQLVGGDDVMRRQYDYLCHVIQHSSTAIRVVPADAGLHPGLDGSFARLSLPEAPPVVFTENRTSQLFIEAPDEIQIYDEALRRILKIALDERESAELIAGIAVEFEQRATRCEGSVHVYPDCTARLADEQLHHQHQLRGGGVES